MDQNCGVPGWEDVLADREAQWHAASTLALLHGGVVSLGINFPYIAFAGMGKDGFSRGVEAGARVFYEAERFISAWAFGLSSERGEIAGSPWCHWPWRGDPGEAKTVCAALEEMIPGGRVLDLDVYEEAGKPVLRSSLGLNQRTCFVCSGNVVDCRVAAKHSAKEISDAFIYQAKLVLTAFSSTSGIHDSGGFAVGGLALAAMSAAALAEELFLTPKPGLVDTGPFSAHTDMDLSCLARSVIAIAPHFVKAWEAGRGWETGRGCGEMDRGESGLLKAITPPGLKADAAMLLTSGGVNTHRGVLFAMGLACAALGVNSVKGMNGRLSESRFRDLVRQLFEEELKEKLGALSACPASAGSAAAKHGGARLEASAGFPGALAAARVIAKARKMGWERRESILLALFDSLARLADSNVLNRAGEEVLAEVQATGTAGLRLFPGDPAGLAEFSARLDRDWSRRGVSPGGSADVLAMGLWIDRLLRTGVLTADEP